jgi:hypothetical protein
MLDVLKERWRAVLMQRYTNGKSVEGWNAVFDDCVATLESIYTDFTRKDDEGKSVSDPDFEGRLRRATGRQYEQRLGEMLFFDRLRREGFDLTTTNGEGPDFRATKNGTTVWFEVVTPDGGKNGTLMEHNANVLARLFPEVDSTLDYLWGVLFRATNAIQTKQKKFAKDIKKGIVGPNDACVIVMNDSLLCPFDLPMFGVIHGAEKPVDGLLPLIVHAVMAKGYRYLEATDEPSVMRRSAPRDAVSNHNGGPVSLTGFLDGSLAHISALLQLTLREDYAFAEYLRSTLKPKEVHHLRMQRGTLLLNPDANIPFPAEFFVADLYSPATL